MKILVISLAGNGDTLFATPLIHELRANFHEAQIDALVLWRAAKDLLDGNPHLNTIYQKNLLTAGKVESLRFLQKLRRQRYDVTFNTHPQSRIIYRMIARFINGRIRVSHRYDNDGWLDRLLVTRSIPQDYGRHAIDNNLGLLKLIEVGTLLPQHGYEIFLTEREHQWAAVFAAQHNCSGRPVFGIHVGSGGTKNLALRRWPLENYLTLIKRLNQSHPEVAVLLFGGPEEEAANARLVAEAQSAQVLCAETRNLREAAALLEHCHGFLSVDTALMHLAAAMKVPRQIVIETPSWNKPIEPRGNPFVLVKNPGVAGRNLDFYRYNGRGIRGTREEIVRSMASVTVPAVYEAVVHALE